MTLGHHAANWLRAADSSKVARTALHRARFASSVRLGPALRVVCFNAKRLVSACFGHPRSGLGRSLRVVFQRATACTARPPKYGIPDFTTPTWSASRTDGSTTRTGRHGSLMTSTPRTYELACPTGRSTPAIHFNAIASRYLIEEVIWVDAAMTRRIPLVRLAVPSTEQRIWSPCAPARHTNALTSISVRRTSTTCGRPFKPTAIRRTTLSFDGRLQPRRPATTSSPCRATPMCNTRRAPRDADGYFVAESIFKPMPATPGREGRTDLAQRRHAPNGAPDHHGQRTGLATRRSRRVSTMCKRMLRGTQQYAPPLPGAATGRTTARLCRPEPAGGTGTPPGYQDMTNSLT